MGFVEAIVLLETGQSWDPDIWEGNAKCDKCPSALDRMENVISCFVGQATYTYSGGKKEVASSGEGSLLMTPLKGNAMKPFNSSLHFEAAELRIQLGCAY